MKKNDISILAVKNIIWLFAERIGAQSVSFIVSLIIARILSPNEYGQVAIISVFISIFAILADGGFGNALIQKKDSDDIDFSTVFYMNIFLSILFYSVLFFCAPFIASFYADDNLVPLIRVSGIQLIILGIRNVQQAYVSRKMQFKKFFYSTLGGTIFSAFVGVGLAIGGFGAWALIFANLSNLLVDMIILGGTIKWRPQLFFSVKRLRALFKFGCNILIASSIQSIYTQLYQLIIGKVYSKSDLAYYEKGKTFSSIIVENIDHSINKVLFPIMSENQNNQSDIKVITKKAMKTNIYIMTPILVILIVVSKPLICLLLTEKWVSMSFYLIIFSFSQMLRPIATANLSALKALGRSDLFFYLEVVKDAIGVSILFLTINKGVHAIAIGYLIVSVICVFVNILPSKHVIGYGLFEQLSDIIPIFLMNLIMGMLINTLYYVDIQSIVRIGLQIIIGLIIYIIESHLVKNEEYLFFVKLIKKIIKLN